MKKILFLLLFLTFYSFPQEFKYAWLSDIHIGNPTGASDLRKVIEDINGRNDLNFVVITGDIAERGLNRQLDTAKIILDKLLIPYHIIPGNHDTKWSESGTTHFPKLFGNDKFSFYYGNTLHIGISSGILLRGGGGHFTPEDLLWVEGQLKAAPRNMEIFFYTHHPLTSDIDNWYKLTNLLRDYNIKSIMVGHGHSNRTMEFNGIPGAMCRSTLSNKALWGYDVVSNYKDSISYYEYNTMNKDKFLYSIKKNKLQISRIDSSDILAYNSIILSKIELRKTVNSNIVQSNNKIFSACFDGSFYCFDTKGRSKWTYKSNDNFISTPTVIGKSFYIGSINDSLLVLDINNGGLITKAYTPGSITSRLTKITFPSKKNGLIAGTSNGYLFCLDALTLASIWENKNSKGMIETRPLISNNAITYGSWDGWLYNIDSKTGKLNWKWTEKDNIYYAPAGAFPCTDGKAIYIIQPDKFVYKIDGNSGKTIWKSDIGQGWESIGISKDKKKIYTKGTDGNFYILSSENGSLIKQIPINYGLDISPTELLEDSGRIIFGAKNGTIYEIDKQYNFKPLIFMGQSRINNVIKLKSRTYAAVNMDGRIVIFKIKD